MENQKTRKVRGSAIITADDEVFFAPSLPRGLRPMARAFGVPPQSPIFLDFITGKCRFHAGECVYLHNVETFNILL